MGRQRHDPGAQRDRPGVREVLAKAGYGAEQAPQQVTGYGSAVRFRRLDHQHLCPVLDRRPRNLEDWEPWSCDLERGHAGPHHHLPMNYYWADEPDSELCGAWVFHGPGRTPGSCILPAGHPPAQRHHDIRDEIAPGSLER